LRFARPPFVGCGTERVVRLASAALSPASPNMRLRKLIRE